MIPSINGVAQQSFCCATNGYFRSRSPSRRATDQLHDFRNLRFNATLYIYMCVCVCVCVCNPTRINPILRFDIDFLKIYFIIVLPSILGIFRGLFSAGLPVIIVILPLWLYTLITNNYFLRRQSSMHNIILNSVFFRLFLEVRN